jgi:hypothetical protein
MVIGIILYRRHTLATSMIDFQRKSQRLPHTFFSLVERRPAVGAGRSSPDIDSRAVAAWGEAMVQNVQGGQAAGTYKAFKR